MVLVLGACAPASQTPEGTVSRNETSPSPPAASSKDAVAGDPDRPCEALTRTECMRSTSCTLEHEAPRSQQYRCRPSREPCEVGFAQAGFWGSGTEGVTRSKQQQAECNARPGCGFVDGGCYCHCRGMGRTTVPDGDEAEDCDCECGGGPPPSCRAQP